MLLQQYLVRIVVFYLVGVVDVADERVDPVLVVSGDPRRPKVSEGRSGMEEVRVVEMLLGRKHGIWGGGGRKAAAWRGVGVVLNFARTILSI